MPGRNGLLSTGTEDVYYEDDYLPRVTTTLDDDYKNDFTKAISVLEKKHRDKISDERITETEDELYRKKVNLYRSIATKNSVRRRSIESDLDNLNSSLMSSRERWSSQTELSDEYVSLLEPKENEGGGEGKHLSHTSPIRTSVSSQSLQSESLPKRTSSVSSLNRANSSASLSTKRFNRSNTSMDSSGSIPEGWERVDSVSGVYYWHVPSGTTQYQHPSLSSNLDLSEKVSSLQISVPLTSEVLEGGSGGAPCDLTVERAEDSHLPPNQHKVINLGYMDMDIATIKGPNSSVAINESIRKLSAIVQDSAQTEYSIQILTFEGTFLKLLDYKTRAVLSKQNILTIRRWGVGSDDVRNFAYVVKQKQASCYRCYVLHCHTPASVVALQMKTICSEAARKIDEESVMSREGGAVPAPPPDTPSDTPTRFETLYLGYIRVEKEKGTDVIHGAIDKLESSNQTNWESVTMEVHVSTINLIKTADRTLLAEHRVRFVSFMALGKQEHHLGYIVHGGPRIFYCHVYQSDSSCADMARSIQNACNARYQLLLAKQEEIKKNQKPEPPTPGIFSFLKKFKKKSPDSERQTLATKS